MLKPIIVGTTTGTAIFKGIEVFLLQQTVNAFTYIEPNINIFNTAKEVIKVFL